MSTESDISSNGVQNDLVPCSSYISHENLSHSFISHDSSLNGCVAPARQIGEKNTLQLENTNVEDYIHIEKKSKLSPSAVVSDEGLLHHSVDPPLNGTSEEIPTQTCVELGHLSANNCDPSVSTDNNFENTADRSNVVPDDALLATYLSRERQIEKMKKELEKLNEKRKLKECQIQENKLELDRIRQYYLGLFASSDTIVVDLEQQNSEMAIFHKDEKLRQTKHLALDTATNLIFTRLRLECQEKSSRMELVRDNLQGFKYTPDSSEAKKLRFRLKHLLDENKTLGRQGGFARIEQLQSQAGVFRRLNEEHRQNVRLAENLYDEILDDMDGLQSTVLLLQQHLISAESVKASLIERLQIHDAHKVEEILARESYDADQTADSVHSQDPIEPDEKSCNVTQEDSLLHQSDHRTEESFMHVDDVPAKRTS